MCESAALCNTSIHRMHDSSQDIAHYTADGEESAGNYYLMSRILIHRVGEWV